MRVTVIGNMLPYPYRCKRKAAAGAVMLGARKPYTDDATRILLSFANAHGGDVFAHWLRNELMLRLHYFSANAVYLDNVASRNASAGEPIRHTGFHDRNIMNGVVALAGSQDKSVVGPNITGKTVNRGNIGVTGDGSYLTIGAMHNRWFEMWSKALQEAKVLIQVQTKEYFESKACAEEMAKIGNKLSETGNRLEVLALTFGDTVVSRAVGTVLPRTTALQVRRVNATRGPLAHLKGAWQIGEADLDRIIKFLKRHGC